MGVLFGADFLVDLGNRVPGFRGLVRLGQVSQTGTKLFPRFLGLVLLPQDDCQGEVHCRVRRIQFHRLAEVRHGEFRLTFMPGQYSLGAMSHPTFRVQLEGGLKHEPGFVPLIQNHQVPGEIELGHGGIGLQLDGQAQSHKVMVLMQLIDDGLIVVLENKFFMRHAEPLITRIGQ